MVATVSILRRPVKHARLRVREDTSVQLIVPQDFDQSLIDGILQKRATWIARHQKSFRERVSGCRTLAPNELLLFGDVYRFLLIPELGHKVVVNETTKEIRSGRDLTRKIDLSRWYRAFARTDLANRIVELSAMHRLPYKRLFIRSQRTKWGTCSTRGNISLNWRLIQAPKYVCDYIIFHELMHTKVLNHSQRFWVLLKAIYPRCDEAILWLNSNSVTSWPGGAAHLKEKLGE